ncbi:hypothetical protein D8T65_10450 [Vibrio vulnificus]|uniref:hypothetical protein n=1 Tax=Vibrio vulnificus TaxID=672 RepID=UPI00102A34E4|nr:hypothetical protein [Vibrio vulnificus]RZQ02630.1 hypothetical protein D8T65_10450 [Vibrio vulnificus]
MQTIQTEFGCVTVSQPYFSRAASSSVRSITLVKDENAAFGWGVCRELPEDLSITPEIITLFAKEASQLM